jgi:hypothetical protein
VENLRAGYEPWKDAKAYVTPHFETDKERYKREAEEAEFRAEAVKANCEVKKYTMKKDAYCIECAGDTEYCSPTIHNEGYAQNDLATLDADLAILRNCKKNGVVYLKDCQPPLKGKYN